MAPASVSTITPDTHAVPGAVAPTETSTTDTRARTAVQTALDRVRRPGYDRWLRHALKTGGCTAPVRLAGRTSDTVDGATGQILTDATSTETMPDGLIYKACGNRRSAVCPACAELYRGDAYQLVLAGLRGGKGIPEAVTGHPAVFATLTAPGFGIVHTTPTTKHGKPAPCRARRKQTEVCPHGTVLRCDTRHNDRDRLLGTPLCPDCYDYDHHTVWNHFAPDLWARTTTRARDLLHRWIKHHGLLEHDTNGKPYCPVRISFGKCAEFQRRGLVHFHILARLDGIDPDDPERVIAPPAWANGFLLTLILRNAVETTRMFTPAADIDDHHSRDITGSTGGWVVAWGHQLDIRPVHLRATDDLTPQRVADELDPTTGRRRILSGEAVAGYLAKYATKSTDVTGHISRRLTPDTIDHYTTPTHPGRIIEAAWRIAHTHRTIGNPKKTYSGLARWAHQLGFGGHFFTKSRRYTITFRTLRKARADYRRRVAIHHTMDHREDRDSQIIETKSDLRYVGQGWLTLGDAELAITAAAQARERQRLARQELQAG